MTDTNIVEMIVEHIKAYDASKPVRAMLWAEYAGKVTENQATMIIGALDNDAKERRAKGEKDARGMSQAHKDGLMWAVANTPTQYKAVLAKVTEIKGAYKKNETAIGVRIAAHLKAKKPTAAQIEAAYQAALKEDAELKEKAFFKEFDKQAWGRERLANHFGDTYMSYIEAANLSKSERAALLQLANQHNALCAPAS